MANYLFLFQLWQFKVFAYHRYWVSLQRSALAFGAVATGFVGHYVANHHDYWFPGGFGANRPHLLVLGIAGFIVGFALQDVLANFAAGAMILFTQPTTLMTLLM